MPCKPAPRQPTGVHIVSLHLADLKEECPDHPLEAFYFSASRRCFLKKASIAGNVLLDA